MSERARIRVEVEMDREQTEARSQSQEELVEAVREHTRAVERTTKAQEDMLSLFEAMVGELAAKPGAMRKRAPLITKYLGAGGLEEEEVEGFIEKMERDLGSPPFPETRGPAPLPFEVRERREQLSRERDRSSG